MIGLVRERMAEIGGPLNGFLPPAYAHGNHLP